jgi:hypothetical protein
LATWGFSLWLLITAAWTVHDGFIRWPAARETRDRYQTVFLEMARHIQGESPYSLVVADGWYEPIDADSLRRNLAYDPGARWVQAGSAIVYPPGGGRLYVPEYAPPAGALGAIGLVPATPLYRSDGTPSFAVYALPEAPGVAAAREPANFGDLITLLGYQLLSSPQDRVVQLVTHWQVENNLPWDLSVFCHLLSGDGAIVAQHDGLDAAVATLSPEDQFIQLHRIPLPDPLPAGPFTLQVGLYRRSAGVDGRLTHQGTPDDRVILFTDLVFDGK